MQRVRTLTLCRIISLIGPFAFSKCNCRQRAFGAIVFARQRIFCLFTVLPPFALTFAFAGIESRRGKKDYNKYWNDLPICGVNAKLLAWSLRKREKKSWPNVTPFLLQNLWSDLFAFVVYLQIWHKSLFFNSFSQLLNIKFQWTAK